MCVACAILITEEANRKEEPVTAAEIQALAKSNPKVLAQAMCADLQEFGYKELDVSTVEAMIETWKAGVKPVGGPAHFVHGWLDKGTG